LLHEGWMHNRVRMIVASFLVKDLHLPWQDGARHFLRHLVDGDLASNSGGWQWVAGTGHDSAPYYRIFNPGKQGAEHDPQGSYVRRYVRELRDVPPASIHRPWAMPGGPPNGYPQPIVDHDAERREALARYAAVRAGGDAGGQAGGQAGRQAGRDGGGLAADPRRRPARGAAPSVTRAN
jgi:deoxyribodipyrimidine photo-lyase